MPEDIAGGVRMLGPSLPYSDGAEHELLDVVTNASDTSSISDELASHVHDWPTRYHLSRQRANLLRTLHVTEDMRILDIGAGTGAIARWLGEQGAEVVALEGGFDRARVAAQRCADLDNVEVVCGPLSAFEDDDGFDLVVLIGVLEYAAESLGGSEGPGRLLARARKLVRANGVLALAIENQLGLKYLLGYAEDHIGEPWIGIENYPTPSRVRTYSRRQLVELLDEAGFVHRRWLYPFPDYKVPKVVLDESAFRVDDAADFVDQLVGKPVRDLAHPREFVCDDRSAHRSLLAAGLGEEVANSFLVIAGGDRDAPARFVDETSLAWLFGDERLSMWMRTKHVRSTETGRVVDSESLSERAERHERGWLSQSMSSPSQYIVGATVEQLALEACHRHDSERLTLVLTTWREHLAGLAKPVPVGAAHSNPFAGPETTSVLPDEYLDANLGNFVTTDEGVHYIDAEWSALGGPDLDVVCARALFYFALDLVETGAEMPWPASTTVDELTVALGALCEFVVTEDLLDRWKVAEGKFQPKITVGPSADGATEEGVTAHLRELGRRAQASSEVERHLPFSRLRREARHARQELEQRRDEFERARLQLAEFERRGRSIAELKGAVRHLEGKVSAQQRLIGELTAHREHLTIDVHHRNDRITELETQLAEAQEALNRSSTTRARRWLRRIARRALRR